MAGALSPALAAPRCAPLYPRLAAAIGAALRQGPSRSMATKPRTLQSWLAVAIMGVLVLVFLVLGVGGGGGRLTDIFANRSDAVIIAGQHVVTMNQFKRIFEQQKQRFDQQAGQPVPLEVIVQNGVDRQMLE